MISKMDRPIEVGPTLTDRVITSIDLDVSKNRGFSPKMDGENNGKPYEQMDDLGGFPIFLETPISGMHHLPRMDDFFARCTRRLALFLRVAKKHHVIHGGGDEPGHSGDSHHKVDFFNFFLQMS